MSWKLVENSNSQKPETIDSSSSNSVVYLRKDFKEVPIYDMENNQIGTRWQYYEKVIPQKDWEFYKSVIEAQSDITDLQIAICDLYESIMGGK